MIVFLAYTLAVLIAAVVDGTLLRGAQSLFELAIRRAGRIRCRVTAPRPPSFLPRRGLFGFEMMMLSLLG